VSRATAVRKWIPAATLVVSSEIEYGLTMSSAPTLTPSNTNCTPAIAPAVDDAVGVAGAGPLSDAPFAGAVNRPVAGDGPGGPVVRGVVKTSTAAVPSVHANPIWLLLSVRNPVRKLRV